MSLEKGMLSWELGRKDSKGESPSKMASHSRTAKKGSCISRQGNGAVPAILKRRAKRFLGVLLDIKDKEKGQS